MITLSIYHRGNYSPCPKFDVVAQANFKKLEVTISRWTKMTQHDTSVRAFKVLEALPTSLQDLFAYIPEDTLMSDDGVKYILAKVPLHIGLRPGDESKKAKYHIGQTNLRFKNKSLAEWIT